MRAVRGPYANQDCASSKDGCLGNVPALIVVSFLFVCGKVYLGVQYVAALFVATHVERVIYVCE